MPPLEHEHSTQGDQERPEVSPVASDSESLLSGTVRSTVTALDTLLTRPKPRSFAQGLFDFESVTGETIRPHDTVRSERVRRPESLQRTLFDQPPLNRTVEEPEPSAAEETPQAPEAPAAVEVLKPLDFTFATGERAKAQDILAAIRTLKTLDQEQRPTTNEERQTLARFAGFGPVALSIFPDPVTGRYKDASWQPLGEELKTLLTPEEYDSASARPSMRSTRPRPSSRLCTKRFRASAFLPTAPCLNQVAARATS